MRSSFHKIIAATALCLASVFPAQTVSALTAKQVVQKEIITINANGQETITRVEPTTMTPGDRVVYRLLFTNDLAEPTDDFELTMPIPGELTLIAGSEVFSGVTTTYSTDQGSSFATQENVRVRKTDGSYRPAGVKDITHIRWQIVDPVAPGVSGELSFAAIIN